MRRGQVIWVPGQGDGVRLGSNGRDAPSLDLNRAPGSREAGEQQLPVSAEQSQNDKIA